MDSFSSSSSTVTPLYQRPKAATITTTKTPFSDYNKPLPNTYSVKNAETLLPLQKKTSPPRKTTCPPPPFFTTIFNAIDDFINTRVDAPTRASHDPQHVLSGNFAPVTDELPPTECQLLEGTLPQALDGAYIRNGPNPQFLPRGPYHLFDGDGMLHCIRIHRGRATLCSRYVKTYKFLAENRAGSAIIPNFFSFLCGRRAATAFAARVFALAARVLAGQYDFRHGFGVANTSLALFCGSLFALAESDLPYTVKITSDGDVVTLGRHSFNGDLKRSMTAHPKTDPETGEGFGFQCNPIPPYLSFFRFSPDGEKRPEVPISSVKKPPFLHDFAITKKYAIFTDVQIRMNIIELFSGGSAFGTDLNKVPRVGVIPLYAEDDSEMEWFEIPGFNIFHAVNAWDEEEEGDDHGGKIISMVAPRVEPLEDSMERIDLIHSTLEKIKINLRTGMVSRQVLSERNLDLAVINPAYAGKKNMYVYAAEGNPFPKAAGVVKVDVSLLPEEGGTRRDCMVASRTYGRGCYGGEPFFVAREPDNPNGDEDDGYVVSYMHNENTGESSFLVMDAKSPTLDIVAAVKLPRRVPYGFHGLFVREDDFSRL